MRVAIEINDAGLVVAGADGVRAIEPGFAVLDGGRIATGTEAYRSARLKPRHASSRFWSTLALEPGSAGLAGPQSAAELAYAQLADLWQRFGEAGAEAVLVVPSHYGARELGVLLGIAQECGIAVGAMVDAAVAAAARPYPGHQLLYADAGLYRVSAIPLEQGQEVTAGAEQALASAGLASVTEMLARRAAELFVLATRFDPLHRAESEQQLYDRLPEWLSRLETEDVLELELPHGAEERRVQVRREQWLAVAQGFYRAVARLLAQSRAPGMSAVVQLSDRLASLPGLVAELERLDDVRVETLAPGHAALAVLADGLWERDPAIERAAGQVKLLKRLAWRGPPVELSADGAARTERPAVGPRVEPPTHVVFRGFAHRVGADGLVVGRVPVDGRRTLVVGDEAGGVSREHCEIVLRDGELRLVDLSRYGTFVNEKRVDGEIALARGDVVRVGVPGAELLVVGVE